MKKSQEAFSEKGFQDWITMFKLSTEFVDGCVQVSYVKNEYTIIHRKNCPIHISMWKMWSFLRVDLFLQDLDGILGGRGSFQLFFNFLNSVHDGRMVTLSQEFPNLL